MSGPPHPGWAPPTPGPCPHSEAHRAGQPSNRRADLERPTIPGPPHAAAIQSLLYALTWSGLLDRSEAILGDIFQVRMLRPREASDQGSWPVVSGKAVLVSSPELLREIFSRSGPELAGGAARQFMEWFLGPDSILVLDGEEHREERRLLMTLFTSERLTEVEAVTEAVTAETLACLRQSGRLSLGPFLNDLIGAIAIRLMFGRIEDAKARRFWACVHEGFISPGWTPPFLLLPWLQKDLGRWTPGGRAVRALAEFRALLAEEVRLTRDGTRPGGTWLARLLAMEPASGDAARITDRRVARVFTILAGMETVAAALRWTFYHLFREPAALARACRRVREGDAAYGEAVCKEAARLHPAIPILARRVTLPTTLGGYPLDPGTYLIGAIYLTHRRPDLYPEPYRFRPERFLERPFSPYEYLPFGGGIRRCAGHGFGLRQAAQVLNAVLREFELEAKLRARLRILRRAVLMIPSDPLQLSWRRIAPTNLEKP